MLPAIVLAAGASTRMGSPKALLPMPGGQPFVLHILETLGQAGVSGITLVTGEHHDALMAACGAQLHDRSDVTVIRNPDPSRGQLSSLQVGLQAVAPSHPEGVLVTLVDVPLVKVSTVRAVLEAWHAKRRPVTRPAIGERHGHPVVFDQRVLPELLAAPAHLGAKAVVRAYAGSIENVPVDDEGCLRDVDTPEDYRAVVR